MQQNLMVTKRSGCQEELDLEKIHRVISWAANDLDGVSISDVELKAHLQFFDGIKTSDIQETLIKTSADLISEQAPDYQYLAARLAIHNLRKQAFDSQEPPPFYDHVASMVESGRYDKHLIEDYSEDELKELDRSIDHTRDFKFSYAAVKQLEGKYLVKNRVTNEVYESPQFLYMALAASLFAAYPEDKRLSYVTRFYDAISLFKISLSTPIMSGVRTPTRQFSSCVLVDCDDSLDSINATASAIVKYVAHRAGLGVNVGRIRALGSPIRNGEIEHTGCIPFYKYFQMAAKSCSQGGVRMGAATLFYPLWHLEVESLLVLKNNRGVDENRVRHLDYGIQLNKLMYQRLIQGGNITLFSPHDVPDLYDAFFVDQDEFERLYEQYEQDESIRKSSIKAVDLFGLLASERASTGRIYIVNVDHCNTHSSFEPSIAPIKQSNLCLEVLLPTKPLTNIDDENGEVALCTLAAVNLAAISELDDFADLSDLVVRALDNLLDYQNYPVKAAELTTLKRRTLGIGVTNFAYYLAKNGVRYSDGSANNLVHRTFEAFQYHMLKASNQLAKEQGPCTGFAETTYAKGILPIDTYKQDIDEYCSEPLHYDWDALREEIKESGLRNNTLTALMPCETSSQINNSTNGIEPPRGYVSVKASKDGILKQVVPEYMQLRDQYELLWDIPSNEGYLKLVGIMQKFVDQGISTNTNYDPAMFPNDKVPMKLLLKDLLTAYKYGIKTLYYHNTRDGATDQQADAACPSSACLL